MSGRPVTNETREQVRQLHAQGLSRNAIARQLQRSGRTISIISAELGLTYDRSATEAATRARKADLDALRVDTAFDLHVDGMKLAEQMWEPAKVFAFGGKDNTYAEKPVDQPPAIDKKNLMAAAGIAFEKSLKLVPPQDDDDSGEVGSLLTSLFDKLRDRHGDG